VIFEFCSLIGEPSPRLKKRPPPFDAPKQPATATTAGGSNE
jgi:hypothetical protein